MDREFRVALVGAHLDTLANKRQRGHVTIDLRLGDHFALRLFGLHLRIGGELGPHIALPGRVKVGVDGKPMRYEDGALIYKRIVSFAQPTMAEISAATIDVLRVERPELLVP